MSFAHSPAELLIELRPSRLYLIVLLCAHFAVVLALLLLPLAGWQRLPALLLVIGSVLVGIRRGYRLDGGTAVTALRLHQGSCALRRGGVWRMVRLQSVTVWGWLVSLQYRDGPHSGAVLVLSDSCDAEDFRCLRVRLQRAVPFAE
jgi:hypothetical protein